MNWQRWFGRAAPDASAPQPGPLRRPQPEAPPSSSAAFADGMAAAKAGRHDEAAACFERALEDAPEFGVAHRELARARIELGQLEPAADALELAAHFQPGDAWTCFLLGLMAQRKNDPETAALQYREALALDGAFAEAHNNLGYVLLNEYDQVDEAVAHFEAALHSRPGFADAKINLGLAALYAGKRAQAISRFDAVLAGAPGAADADLAKLNRALARLALGQWAKGWDEYEARKRAFPARPAKVPEWNGGMAPGKTVLLYGEQGLGDEIMFASCIPDAIGKLGACVIECSPRLVPLFARSFSGCMVRPGPSAANRDAPAADLECATGSLPRLFRRTASAFPRHQGFLRADPAKIAAWDGRLRELGARPKIALSWRGGTRQTRQARRSIDVTELADALRPVPADFISLQYGDVGRDLEAFAAAGLAIQHWPEAIADYDETAALLDGVDLVLSVCTALVHLGGALGRPVWVMAPAFPEWRYGDSGAGMPWYPSVRVLRQSSAGDWASVLAKVAEDLRGIGQT